MNVVVFGGSGFVGRHLAARLCGEGHAVLVPTRRLQNANHLKVFPTAEVVEADIHDPAVLAELLQSADVAVNLVGILKGGEGVPYGAGFGRAHVELPRRIGAEARRAGVVRLLHISALKASAGAPSGYLRSKAAGEAALRDEFPATTIFRPSVIFGRGDSFLTLFAQLSRRLPAVPLACPAARFQPVWAGDVAEVMVRALAQRETAGAAYDLCGPKVYSLRQLVALAGELAGCRRPIIGLSPALSYLQALVMEFVPGGPMTRDNVRSMRVASVCEGECTLPFGLAATPLEGVASDYLGRASR